MEKGILTKKQTDVLAKYLDDKIKLTGLKELFDGIVFDFIISIIDDYGLNKIKQVYKDKLGELVVLISKKDYDNAALKAGEILDLAIDFRYVSEKNEALVIENGINFLTSLIKIFLDKEEQKKLKLKPKPKENEKDN